jgi:hypothetical protein
MKATRITTHILTTLTAAGISLAFLPAVHAQTLSFTNTPASSAAMAMSKRYGVTIVFRGSINTGQPVTFSVDNPDTPDGRLQAVSNLASALNLDFQKVYVVSKVDPGAAVPAVPVDSDGPIVFTSTHIPAREAIQTVAAVDNALTQISSLITGDVTLPSTHMTAFEAAASISKQTGTEWKTYYGLFKRSETPARFNGEVIGQTNNGQSIRVLPLLTFRSTVPVTVPLHSGEDAVVGPFDALSGDPTVASVPNTNFDTAPDTGFGFGDPYGYTDPYGVYGYAAPDGTIAVPGAVVTPGAGISPAVPGVNAPGATGVAGPTGATFAPVP